MNGRETSLALVFALAVAAPALAQQTSKTCPAQDAVGFIGISGVECNCTIGSPDPDKWAFRTEPRITSLEMTTHAGKILKIGDVITHVNGQLITTREGARALASIKPGEAVVLTVRRGGESLKFALTAESSCPGEARLGIYAPSLPQGKPPVATGSARRAGVTPHPPKAAAAPTARAAVAGIPVRTRGSFGIGLTCSRCEIRGDEDGALYFSEPPEVYSVERGSSADMAGIRRGDVITHVNDQPITSEKGGRTFGTAKPGSTVRFTFRRGGQSRTVPLTAAAQPRPAPSPAIAQSTESLDRAQQSLRELEREQQRQLQKIQEELRRSRAADEQKLMEIQREFLRQEQEHRRKLSELSGELARADARVRAALADSARSCAVAVAAPRAGVRTLRYTGIIGDSEIEVRGPNPVTVMETGDEVTISTGQTQVTVKKTRK